MIATVTVSAQQCTCDLCGYVWVTLANAPPTCCANPGCRSRRWNGGRRAIRSGEIKLPAPRPPGRPKTAQRQQQGEDDGD